VQLIAQTEQAMAISSRQIKVSDMVEKNIAFRLGVQRVAFKRLKYVKAFVMRFTFFVYDIHGFVGTVNFIWDLRKLQQLVILRNFQTNKIMIIRHFNEPRIKGFFPQEI
jgi:hypothetical protein